VVLVASGEVSQQWVAQWVARWVLLLATQYSGPAAAGETRVVLDSELRGQFLVNIFQLTF
jgi:hypothetical protein